MFRIDRGFLIFAAALAVGASSAVRAGDGGDGGDSGDNGMNPMYGDSYATLEGQGHNVGASRIAPQGAYAAHEMDGMRPVLSPTPITAAATTSSAVSPTPSTSVAPTVPSTMDASRTTAGGYRIAPVNPKGQAPTVVGPGG